MAIEVTTQARIFEYQAPQLSRLDEVAETLRDDALTAVRESLRPTERALDLKTLLRRPDFVNRFKHQLTLGVAQVLAAYDETVREVHVYDPTMSQESEISEEVLPDPAMSLIVVAAAPSAGLAAFARALDRALTASLKQLPSSWAAGRDSLLDLAVVAEKDVAQGVGPARLLAAVYTPPMKIWQRDARDNGYNG